MTHPLKAVRQSRGLTQAELAELAGVSQQSVSRIEAGGHIAYGAVLPKLAAALGVGVAEILNEDQCELAALLDGKRLAACWLGLDPDAPALDHLRAALETVR